MKTYAKTGLIFLVVVYALFAILALQGCDNTNCRPDGAIEENKKDFWVGFKCKRSF